MNYIGSKIKLLSFIDKSIKQVLKNTKCDVFCDIFAGIGTVGAHFKKQGYKIIANDLQYYSYVLNKQIIGNHLEFEFKGLYNLIPEIRTSSKEDRKYIVCEYFFLIASLIKTVDSLANVLSVYGAYLKYFKKSALKKLKLKPYDLIVNDKDHEIYNKDANLLIKDIKTDILYIDPPYNERQYSTNYHLLETIVRFDKPLIYGKTGLRPYKNQKSKYCSKEFDRDTFKELIKNANAKYIFVSYNNEGIMSKSDIKEILREKGEYGCFEQKYSRYKSDSNRNYSSKYTIEYLHYCKVY